MTDIPEDKTDARKIEKRRSWKEIASSASSAADPSADDYAIELELFERGEIDKSLWAKHLIECQGDREKAKWLYLRAKVISRSSIHAKSEVEAEVPEAGETQIASPSHRSKSDKKTGCLSIILLIILALATIPLWGARFDL